MDMPTEQMNSNPYASPQAEEEGPKRSHRFRWRLIPAGILMAFGGVMAFFGVAGAIGSCWAMSFPDPTPEIGKLVRELPSSVSLGFAGCIWVYSGVVWWKRRWWRAALTTLLGYAIAVLTAFLRASL